MISEATPTMYSVRVNGVIISANIPSRPLAELAVMNLPPNQRPLAEIVAVTTDGKDLLFG